MQILRILAAGTGADAYVITHAEIDQKIEETLALGGTQILMQGGHHPRSANTVPDLLAHIREKFPTINVHGFSPSEFVHFRDVFDEPLEDLVRDFAMAGLGSIPGGGGEFSSTAYAKDFAAQGHEQ